MSRCQVTVIGSNWAGFASLAPLFYSSGIEMVPLSPEQKLKSDQIASRIFGVLVILYVGFKVLRR